MVDFYGIQAKQYLFVIEEYPRIAEKILGGHAKHVPGCFFSVALAHFLQEKDGAECDRLLIEAIHRYPRAVLLLDEKISLQLDALCRRHLEDLASSHERCSSKFSSYLEKLYVERCSGHWKMQKASLRCCTQILTWLVRTWCG